MATKKDGTRKRGRGGGGGFEHSLTITRIRIEQYAFFGGKLIEERKTSAQEDGDNMAAVTGSRHHRCCHVCWFSGSPVLVGFN